jgi:hypothetical protein
LAVEHHELASPFGTEPENIPAQPMTVGVSSLSTGVHSHVYTDIITGVSASQIANENELMHLGDGLLATVTQSTPAGVRTFRAEPVADWDLRVFNYGADMANPQAFLLESNWLALRYALDYDCKLFDANGVCVAINAQYSNYNGYADDSEFAGTLSAAVQFGGKFRLGGFLDVRTGPDDYTGVSDVSMMPMFGLFLGYSDAPDGTGIQARVSGAYQHSRADFTHVNLLGEDVTASGEAGMDTWGAAAELGFGYGFGNGHVLTPFLGVTYATSQRDSYTDGSDGGAVADTLHFDSYAARYATGVLGLRLHGPLADAVSYQLGVGVEDVFEDDLDSFKISGDFGTVRYDSTVAPSQWAVSGAAGLSYRVDVNKELTLDGYIREVEAGQSPYVAVNAGFRMGF